MDILINSSNSTNANHFEQRIRASLENELDRFEERLTRVEVHLSDENSSKKSGPADKRCQMEARIKARDPVSVTHKADSYEQAIAGATGKLNNALEHTFGRLDNRQ
ncbi:HPF/RaiA family ribosome-associated protein [Azomonas macrocytogenes]|uniref:Ribosome-associated translation inhibitor RaiA n=1 Tax=Azomonas macrocytogenes TaxID=69962 RepID=A0A839T8T8_AZOMA|nr:HPF/RaiA family ribosome-associated protein [Azomonas macrocytogenes]MBB3104876.1 ribosome-associated translation inhibitor RaiA [Azomonas macrocytogenes]